MIKKVNIHETKTHLSKLLAEVESGVEIVICRSGKPIAHIVPEKSHLKERTPGTAKGRIRIADNFDEPLPEHILKSFHNENPS